MGTTFLAHIINTPDACRSSAREYPPIKTVRQIRRDNAVKIYTGGSSKGRRVETINQGLLRLCEAMAGSYATGGAW